MDPAPTTFSKEPDRGTMLDGFVLSHPEVRLTQDCVVIDNIVIARDVMHLCTDESLKPIPLDLFSTTALTRIQELHVAYYVQKYMLAHGLTEHIRPERLLLEIVLLHRLSGIFQEQRMPIPPASKAIAVMGAMIQERLIELLLALDKGQRSQIFGIRKIYGLSRETWETNFVGAVSVIRAIHTWRELEGVTIRLPTIEVDLEYGIDLLVTIDPKTSNALRHKTHLAVSVKSFKCPDSLSERLRFQLLAQGIPTGKNGDRIPQQQIISGAKAVSIRYERKFIPILLWIGRDPDLAYEFRIDQTEFQTLERLLVDLRNNDPSQNALPSSSYKT